MRWMVRTVAALSVVTWLVAAGLFARPVGSSAEVPVALSHRPPTVHAPLPSDWTRRVLAETHVFFPGVSRSQAEAVMPYVERHSRRFGVDPLMVLAVIHVESRFDPMAMSDRGAIGLMQLQSATARDVATELGVPWTGDDLLYDPDLNVELGCAYLRRLMDRFEDQDAALAAYCSGPTLVEARQDANDRIPLAYSDRVWDVLTSLRSKVAA